MIQRISTLVGLIGCLSISASTKLAIIRPKSFPLVSVVFTKFFCNHINCLICISFWIQNGKIEVTLIVSRFSGGCFCIPETMSCTMVFITLWTESVTPWKDSLNPSFELFKKSTILTSLSTREDFSLETDNASLQASLIMNFDLWRLNLQSCWTRLRPDQNVGFWTMIFYEWIIIFYNLLSFTPSMSFSPDLRSSRPISISSAPATLWSIKSSRNKIRASKAGQNTEA